jgi:hypothetical protein
MDSPFIIILQTLELQGVGQFADIAPTLLSIYPIPDNADNYQKQETSQKITSFLTIMEKEGLLSFDGNRFAMLGGGINGHVTWLTEIKIMATIGTKGLNYLSDDRNQKMVQQVNQSVIDTNTATTKFIPVQKNIAIASVIISAVALVFSIIAIFRDNGKEVRTLNNTLQLRLQKLDTTLQNLRTPLVDSPTLKE